MRCLLKSCRKCGGDLVLDGDEWRCWQCGQYYYPRSSEPLEMPPDPSKLDPSPEQINSGGETRQRRGRRAPRNVNSAIEAQTRSNKRWWARNKILIRYLDEGKSVREIAVLVCRDERQVRIVREKLGELRAAAGAYQ